VSKFFKALENAEREREAEGAAAVPGAPAAADPAAPTAPAAGTAPPVTARVAEPPPVAAPPTPAPIESPPPAPARPAAPEPARRETPPRRVTRQATAPAAEAVPAPPPEPARPETPPARPASRPAPPAEAAPARTSGAPMYGAPLARSAATHERAFDGILPPAAVSEPGELDDHLVSLLEPTSVAAERYRTVRLHIENLRNERDVRLVAVSSPSRGDGKTITAINLAGALAQAPDARVALVEVDVRHPGMARYLGLSPYRGLSTYLLDAGLGVDDVLERPSGVGFAVVVAGPASSMPYELLKSPRLGALLGDLRQRFDFVLVDTPPVLPFPDVGIVRDLVDGFVLVVRANRTPREMVRDSLATIGTDRALGVLFNDDERSAVTVSRDDDEAGWRAVLPRARGGVRAA